MARALTSASYADSTMRLLTTINESRSSCENIIVNSINWDLTDLAFSKIEEAAGFDIRSEIYLLPIVYIRGSATIKALNLTATGKQPDEYRLIGRFDTSLADVKQRWRSGLDAAELALEAFCYGDRGMKHNIRII